MSVQLIPNDPNKRKWLFIQQNFQIFKQWKATGNRVEVAQKYQLHPQME